MTWKQIALAAGMTAAAGGLGLLGAAVAAPTRPAPAHVTDTDTPRCVPVPPRLPGDQF